MPDQPERLNPDNIIFERRKYVRINKTFVISYTDMSDAQAKSDVSQTKNISIGGVLFTTDRDFPPDTILKVKLKLPDLSNYVEVKVKVIDSLQRIKDISYETRVKFIDLKEEEKNAIRQIVDHHLKK